MIGAIESALDQQLLSFFMTTLSDTLNIYYDHRNPFADLVLPLAIQHTGLMHSLLSLSGSSLIARQKDPSHDLVLRQSHHFDKAIVVLRKDIELHESRPGGAVNTDYIILQTILHCIETSSADGSGGDYRCHLQAAHRLINRCQSDDNGLQHFAQQFLVYQTLANSISALLPVNELRTPVAIDSPQMTSQSATSSSSTDLLGVLDGLISPIFRIRDLKDEIRSLRIANSGAWCADERLFYDAFAIDTSLRAWTCDFDVDTPAYYAALLYRQVAWIYLYRTMKPSSSSPELAQGVKEGLAYMGRLLPRKDEPKVRTWTSGILLPPLYLLGCAAFEQDQRREVLAGFDAIQEYSHMGNVAHARRIVERVWQLMDQGRRQDESWDWESVMTKMGLDVLVS